eukprot:m.25088 g.25088  ORF g.25088 m.25088 type:complete len:2054 (+) comp4210_c0_seq1:177-6338(+)
MDKAKAGSGPKTRSRSSGSSPVNKAAGQDTSRSDRKREPATSTEAAADAGTRRSRRLKVAGPEPVLTVAKTSDRKKAPAGKSVASSKAQVPTQRSPLSGRRRGKRSRTSPKSESTHTGSSVGAAAARRATATTAASSTESTTTQTRSRSVTRRGAKRVRKGTSGTTSNPTTSASSSSAMPGGNDSKGSDDPFAGMAAAAAWAVGDVDGDEGAPAPDEGRHMDHASALQALLARVTGGASASFDLGGFGGGSRYKSLLDDIQAEGDDMRQEAALRKLTEMLLMGNEETLSGFRPNTFVPVLHTLLQADHRPQVALLACDCLCNMLEAVPQSSSAVAQCASALCAKLLSIEYIDLAERALDTISKLANDQGSALLKAGGLNSTLQFIDFFPIAQQRSAVATSIKMCEHVTPERFDLAKDVVPQLSNLLTYQDRVIVESACDCFAKLVERVEASPTHVLALTEHGLLPKLLAIVSATPRVVGRSTVSTALGMIASVLRAQPVLAEGLHESNVAASITPLLTGADAGTGDKPPEAGGTGTGSGNSTTTATTATPRLGLSPSQLGQLMDLVYELLPPLPPDVLVERAPVGDNLGAPSAKWQWRGGDSWSTYDPSVAAVIEDAHAAGRKQVVVKTSSGSYTVDLEGMVQINMSTGMARRVQRLGPPRPAANAHASGQTSKEDTAGASGKATVDPRVTYFKSHAEQIHALCTPLIAPLFDLLLSVANPMLLRKVLRVLVKIVHWCSAEALNDPLRDLAVSSYLTNVLRSAEPDLVIGALQMATDLITKLPDVFAVYFRREGVLFEICCLSLESSKAAPSPSTKSRGKGKARAKAPRKHETARAKSGTSQASRSGGTADHPDNERTAKQHAFAADAAYELLETHFEKAMADKGPLADPHPAMDLLRELNALAVKIDPMQQDDPTIQRDALAKAQALLAADDVKVSSFEMWSSSLLTAMYNYLTFSDKDKDNGVEGRASSTTSTTSPGGTRLERIKHFCSLFFRATNVDGARVVAENGALSALVRATHGAIHHTEKFPCETLDDADAFLATLKTPIKLQLVAADGTSLKALSSNMVMIEPFASIQAIEDFLWPRVRRSSAEKARDEATLSAVNEARRAAARAAAQQAMAAMETDTDGAAAAAATASAQASAVRSSLRRRSSAASSPNAASGASAASGSATSGAAAAEAKAQARAKAAAREALVNAAMAAFDDDSEEDSMHSMPYEGHDDSMGDDEDLYSDDYDDEDADEVVDETFASPDDDTPPTAGRSGVVDLSDLPGDGDGTAAAAAASGTSTPVGKADGTTDKGGAAAPSRKAAAAAGGGGGPPSKAGTTAATAKGKSGGRNKPLSSSSLTSGGAAGSTSSPVEEGTSKKKASPKASSRPASSSSAGAASAAATATAGGGGGGSASAASGRKDSESSAAGQPRRHSHSNRHIQVLMNNVPLEQTTTIYQAIQQHERANHAGSHDGALYRHLSGRVYTVTYREYKPSQDKDDKDTTAMAIDGSAAATRSLDTTVSTESGHPVELQLVAPPVGQGLDPEDPVYTPIMLLRALHRLNETVPRLFPGNAAYAQHVLSPDDFLNHALASKLTRQVSDLEKICAGSFPPWCGTLILTCPFLIPFEAKKLFFFYTAFGSVRALVHYQDVNSIPEADSGDRALPSRISRIKVKISRKRVFRSLMSMEESMVNSRSIMEIMFKDEIGTGLGPTLEFYALAARAWQEKAHNMWRDDTTEDGDDAKTEHVLAPHGLYPLPRSPGTSNKQVDALFETFGMFLARAILDGRILDLALNRCFMVWLRGREAHLGLSDLAFVDQGLYTTLTKLRVVADERAALLASVDDSKPGSAEDVADKVANLTVDGCPVDDLSLTFVLPGFPEIELCPGGADVAVTMDNLAEYVDAVVQVTLVEGVRAQMAAVRSGFNAVFPLDALRVFSPAELEMLVSGCEPATWDADALKAAITADHGFTRDSPQLEYLRQVMSEFNHAQQRLFLSFITGSPRLPVGGFRALRPRLTVVRKNVSNPDGELPSVMTCQNYLKLPPYSSVDVCRTQLITAMTEGQGSFMLS